MEFVYLLGIIFQFCNPAMKEAQGVEPLPVWAAFVIASAVFVLVYAFKAVGLYTMAKNAKKEKLLWCAFVPFASTYLIGELAGDVRFGNVKIKRFGLYAMAFEILYVASSLMQTIPAAYAFTNNLYTITESSVGDIVYVRWAYSASFPQGVVKMANVAYVLDYIFMVLFLIAEVFMLIGFFRKYAPASYIWMVILCAVISIATAFLIFAFRNRAPVDYNRYMQARAERYRRMQQAQYGPYGPYGQNPYGQNPYGNPYGRPQNGQPSSEKPDDPFGEYSSKGAEDPFGEYSGDPSSERKSEGEGKKAEGDSKKPPEDPFA